MKRFCATLTSLAIGGFLGCEYHKKLSEKYALAAAPVTNRPTEIMKYGFPSTNNLKVMQRY